jgi:hypothetical protein
MATHCVKPGQIYQHYKGFKYLVLSIAKHSEMKLDDKNFYVVYKSLYKSDNPLIDDYQVWIRPLDMFKESVDGTPRFKLLYEEEK